LSYVSIYFLLKNFNILVFFNSKLKLINEAEKIITNTIICTICGGAGHVQSDCKFRKSPAGTFMTNGNRQEQQKFDCEVS
jgi:hypothetical protein